MAFIPPLIEKKQKKILEPKIYFLQYQFHDDCSNIALKKIQL